VQLLKKPVFEEILREKYLRAGGIPQRKPHPKRGSKLDPC